MFTIPTQDTETETWRCLPPSSPNFVASYVPSQEKISRKSSDDITESALTYHNCTLVWTHLHLGTWASLGSGKQHNVCMNRISFKHFNIKFHTTVLQVPLNVFFSLVTTWINILQRVQSQNKAVYKDHLQWFSMKDPIILFVSQI